MAGLFELVEELFGVRVVERSTIHHNVGDANPVVDVWHGTVRAYDLFEEDKRIGFFYRLVSEEWQTWWRLDEWSQHCS